MGPDLYISSIFDKVLDATQEKWDAACERYNELLEFTNAELQVFGSVSEREQRALGEARAEVDRLYSIRWTKNEGYFRDGYNDSSNLLWQFGLSWWVDVDKLIEFDDNDRPYLTISGCRELLDMMSAREPVFLEKVNGMAAGDAEYFRGKYERFKEFINTAIKLNEPIVCSV